MNKATFGDIISQRTVERVRRDNCFDFLRYLFAFSLILVHFCTLTDTPQFWFISGQMRVKAFFTITGFLVVYSFLRRKSLRVYCWKRLLRIVPAYVTTIFLCFIIGIFFTDATPKEYLMSSQTAKYLLANLSFLNFIEPSLPGLFTDNPYGPFVNGSLWSMKYEVLFYILVPPFVWLMRKWRKSYVVIAIFALNIAFHILFSWLESTTGNPLYSSIANGSHTTMVYFFSGTAILLYFDWFCDNIKWIFPSCIVYMLLTLLLDCSWLYYLEPLVFSATIISVAYYCTPLNFLQRYDNISYGLYLYHFPVIQILVQYRLHQYNIYLAFFVALLATILLAITSWYIIEKPALRRKVD